MVKSIRKHSIWNVQFGLCALLFCCLLLLYYLNYFVVSEPIFCKHKPFDPWLKDYTVLVLGAALGNVVVQYFRIFIATQGYSDGKLRHPLASRMLLFIASIQALANLCFHWDLLPFRCTDVLGVQTYPFLWFEWICTIPFMFFLILMLDVKKKGMNREDWRIQYSGGGSIITLFLCNIPIFPKSLLYFFFLISNISMAYALFLLYFIACREYKAAKDQYENIIVRKQEVDKNVIEQNKIAQWKMNSSVFTLVSFHIFPILYYLQLLQLITPEVAMVGNLYSGFVCKLIISQILFDAHVEVLDPNAFLLIDEKRKSEEAKLMFFRYVFHEVRVPLNSIVLGLQLLQENEHLTEMEKETLGLMRDATSFMTETLNDVLSLQKIEVGMLQLEYQPFTPTALVKAVLSNFKTQYEAKGISIHCLVDDNVPPVLIGDQFRLEHVLGNLVSNAIKFSDLPASTITIRVSYESHLQRHVTFSVRDEGPGMSEEEMKYLFQPFMQIRPGELQKGRGSGLGLSICKTIVNLHNDTISCRSQKRTAAGEGGGTEFYFSIDFELPDDSSTSFSNLRRRFSRSSKSEEEKAMPTTDETQTAPEAISRAAIDRTKNDELHPTESSPNNNRQLFPDHNEFLKSPRKPRNHSNSSSISTLVTASATPPVSPKKEEARRESEEINSQREPDLPTATPSLNEQSAAKRTKQMTEQETVERTAVRTNEEERAISSPKVMVCDDVHSNRKMLDMILKKKGLLDSDLCCDGSEAVASVQSKGADYYHVIFMDNMMPNLCGPAAAKEIRSLGYGNLLIGVTGNAMEIDVVEYEAAGADAVLVKPVKIEHLNRLIDYCQRFGYRSPVHTSSSFAHNGGKTIEDEDKIDKDHLNFVPTSSKESFHEDSMAPVNPLKDWMFSK